MPSYPAIPRQEVLTHYGTVLTRGNEGQWDRILWGAASPVQIVYYDGVYYMFYTGADVYDEEYPGGATPINRKIGLATSTDRVSWTKHGPVIEFGDPDTEQGAVGLGVLTPDQTHDGKWHGFYSANTEPVTPGTVDMDIRHRATDDPFDWVTGVTDSLVKQNAGHEYRVVAAYYDGSNYSCYYVHIDGSGGGAGGRGPLRRMYGSNPTTLSSGDDLVTSDWYQAGNYAIGPDAQLTWMFHVAGSGNVSRYHIRQTPPGSLSTISSVLRNWQESTSTWFQPVILWDAAQHRWRVYRQRDDHTFQLHDSLQLAEIRLTASAFSDPDEDASGGRRWRIYTDEETPVLVYDSGWVTDSTTHDTWSYTGDWLATVQDRDDTLEESAESAQFPFSVALVPSTGALFARWHSVRR